MENLDFLQFYPYLKYIEKHLHIDGFPITQFTQERETPFFLFLPERFKHNYDKMKDGISKHIPNLLISYALKANYLGGVLDIATSMGLGAEVMSLFELKLAKRANFTSDKIVFNGPAKSFEELNFAISKGIRHLNVDSLNELKVIEEIAKNKNHIQRITIRIHPQLNEKTEKRLLIKKNSKLGIDFSRGVKLFEYAKRSSHLDPVGVHVHVGTNLVNHDFYEELLIFINDYVIELERKLQITIQEINLGGGLASSSLLDLNNFSFTKLGEQLSQYIENYEKKLFIFEPGRYLIEDSFVAITKILRSKKSWGRKWVFTDIGANTLIPMRYTLYKIIPVIDKGKGQYTNVGGPLCLPVDVISNEAVDFEIEENDLLVILNCGAYTISMSEQFGYPRPAIYELRKEGKLELIKAADDLNQMVEKEFHFRKARE